MDPAHGGLVAGGLTPPREQQLITWAAPGPIRQERQKWYPQHALGEREHALVYVT
jgi:hypothetical protein